MRGIITLTFMSWLGLVAGIVVLSFLLSYPIMLLWNGCLVDAVVGVQKVTWPQMWGLMILFSILFKSSTGSSK